MILFGIIQIILSQIPDFDQIWWLSIVAAIMSLSYSIIGLGLGITSNSPLSIFRICISIFDQAKEVQDFIWVT